jgi:hypothetical protein
MPRNFAARANHAVERHCGDGFEVFHSGGRGLGLV